MCGRFTQHYTWAEIHAFLRLSGPSANLRPRYNIVPTTQIGVAGASTEGRTFARMRWGLAPGRWKKGLGRAARDARCGGIVVPTLQRALPDTTLRAEIATNTMTASTLAGAPPARLH